MTLLDRLNWNTLRFGWTRVMTWYGFGPDRVREPTTGRLEWCQEVWVHRRTGERRVVHFLDPTEFGPFLPDAQRH